MNNLDSLKWGALLSSVGIAFGWFLNQLTGWWRVRREDKRVLKKVLFNLFEVNHLLSLFDINDLIEKLIAKVLPKIPPEENTPENIQILRNRLYSELARFVQSNTSSIELNAFEETYQRSIEDLSKIEPIQAFYLSGKTKILDYIKLIDKWIDYASQKYSEEASEIEIVKRELSDKFSPLLLTEAIKGLKDEIIRIAWKINLIVWWRTKKILNKKSKPDPAFEKTIDEILDNFIQSIQTQNHK